MISGFFLRLGLASGPAGMKALGKYPPLLRVTYVGNDQVLELEVIVCIHFQDSACVAAGYALMCQHIVPLETEFRTATEKVSKMLLHMVS